MKAPGRIPELLRQRESRRYWSAQTISMLGDQVSSVAIPYTGILALHADAAEMGFLTAAIWLPSLIVALHAGAWADRFGHRRILMITADLGRAALLALIPVAALLHVLARWQLYAVAFAVGTLSVLFTVCDLPCSWRSCPAGVTWPGSRSCTAAAPSRSSAGPAWAAFSSSRSRCRSRWPPTRCPTWAPRSS